MDNINIINPQEHDYLKISECIADLSDKLYVMGELPATRQPSVAIVGSRKPTTYGKEITERIAGELAKKGVVIISGLAIGVDALAHKATLAAGGTTIAVLANGLHRIYPNTNRELAKTILAKNGAILSEYEPGVEPMQHRFLERNRIVSGLSDIVIVTEAASRSGTLNTAAHALNQGKIVFAVPGNITSPMSAGCNQLIKQGAIPLLDTQDVLEALGLLDNTKQMLLPIGSTPLENDILKSLQKGIRDGDAILQTLGANPSEFNTALTMLEINGAIKALGANQWTLI